MSEYKLPAPSFGKTACDCIRSTFGGQGELAQCWYFDMDHFKPGAWRVTCPRILWITLWETLGQLLEVLDFQDFSALHSEPARVALSQ
jgi:hypothetical protein